MPILLCITVIFTIWLKYESGKASRANKKNSESFWERERLANETRRHDLSALNYITIPLERLPFHSVDNEELQDTETDVRNLSKKKLVNLSEFSNTDLKFKYGSANLPDLMEFDNNFTVFVRTFHKWGELLYKLGYIDDAIDVLSFSIDCGADSKNTYLLLGKLYADKGAYFLIEDLIDRISSSNAVFKDSIIEELNALSEAAPAKLS